MIPLNHVIVDAVFHVRRAILAPEELLGVGFVFGEQQFRFAFAEQPTLSVGFVFQLDRRRTRRPVLLFETERFCGACFGR